MELQLIQSKIYEIRGARVMLDSDLAALYQVETKVLKQSIKRNIDRFEGDDFMFELTQSEYSSLRSQIVTLKNGVTESLRGKHSKYLPMAFTEMGVAMLSSVLKSNIAIKINRDVMRAFVAARQLLSTTPTTSTISAELADIRAKMQLLEQNDELTLGAVNDLSEDMRGEIADIYLAIGELSAKPTGGLDSNRRRIGFKTH